MAGDSDTKQGWASKGIAVASAASGAAAGAAMVSGAAGSAALGAVLTSGLDIVLGAVTGSRARKAQQWWDAYVATLGTMTSEGAVTEAVILTENADFQERVYHALNAVWAAVDEAVLPSLAFLAADYQARGRPVDVSYKRLARFLQETSKEELETARTLIAEIAAEMDEQASAPSDSDERKDGVPVLAERGVAHVKLGARRRDLPGLRADGVLARLQYEHLVDSHNVFGQITAVFVTGEQLALLKRYLARPFA